MSGDGEAGHRLPATRRRALFRAWHRGTREMDLLLGRFADAKLAGLDDRDLRDFELLMEAPDGDLFAWIVGTAPVPERYDTPIFRHLRRFHKSGHGAE